MVLGNSADTFIDLKLSSTGNETMNSYRELQHFKISKNTSSDYDSITSLLVASILPRCSKLNITFEHAKPALIGEWYEINVIIKNEEEFAIRDLQIEISSSITQLESGKCINRNKSGSECEL